MYDSSTYLSEIKNELSEEDCLSVIGDFESSLDHWSLEGRINFTGGDPLLRDDFFSLLDYSKSKNISSMILGNPNHLTHEVAERLKESGLSGYQLSIDGMEKVHDYLRKPGHFKDTLRALDVLNDVEMSSAVMFTVSKLNVDDLLDVIDLVADKNVSYFAFSRLVPTGSGKELEDQMFSPDEYRSLLSRVHDKYTEFEENGCETIFVRKDHLWSLLYKEMGIMEMPPDEDMIYGGCSIGVNGLAILADGYVLGCRRLPVKVGKVPEQSIKDIFINSKNLNIMRQYEEMEKCGDCEITQICRGCPAVAYGATGNYFAPDPQCWK